MKSRLISRSITIDKIVSGTAEYLRASPTHLNGGDMEEETEICIGCHLTFVKFPVPIPSMW